MMHAFFPRKAIVLSAGLGTRMRPLTDTMPKPLVPVAGRPLIDWSLQLLADAGIQEVIVNTHYLAEQLHAHLAQGTRPAIRISHEDTLLETGGGIRHALPMLGDEPFFALNSDTIALNGAVPYLQRMAARWDDAEMDALLLLASTDSAIGYQGKGDFHLGGSGELRRRQEGETTPYVFSGVQLLHPRLFDGSPEGAFSMNLLYNRGIASDGALERVKGIAHDGMWLHVGDPAGRDAAEKALAALQQA